ncbi:peptidase family M48-domain-containing protein [Thamnocephalis sphaerospora]|uniref:Peptidase family M48-domain-containing protein n=1 Tax=Thamnocephalis sphaerospora TaxID=78915 RepID=A0A4P9XM25_9FUNG|nr:peptidase family M48-domain-containing protein [Thamnocephalis sphaerospora]|eukprot:RKP06411.1 peptidase family M48-domain-containing protein [Thamnocephalis sphaerospora]
MCPRCVERTKAPLGRQPWFVAVCGIVTFGGYYLAHLDTVPISGRRRFIDITPKQEAMIAQVAYDSIIEEVRHAMNFLPDDHPDVIVIRKVAQRLIRATGLTGLNWEIHVVASSTPNAFVLPGGKIFVYTGILPIMRDEDGVAAVLGHEIAHQVARHSAEKFTFTKARIVVRCSLTLVGAQSGRRYAVASTPLMRIMRAGLELPFSRKCETEADQVRSGLMAQACFDPTAAIDVWKRMEKAHGHRGIEYMSTHPRNDSRVRNFERWMPEAQERRAQSDCNSGT